MIGHRETICIKSYESLILYLGFTARQDYFTHFEPSQNKRFPEKNLTTGKQNLACPTCDPSQARTHSGEMIERLRALYTITVAFSCRTKPIY